MMPYVENIALTQGTPLVCGSVDIGIGWPQRWRRSVYVNVTAYRGALYICPSWGPSLVYRCTWVVRYRRRQGVRP